MKQESYSNSESFSNKAILVGVRLPGDLSSTEISLDELTGLATTAEYEPVVELTQRLTEINPKTFFGSGKCRGDAGAGGALCGAQQHGYVDVYSLAGQHDLHSEAPRRRPQWTRTPK